MGKNFFKNFDESREMSIRTVGAIGTMGTIGTIGTIETMVKVEKNHGNVEKLRGRS